MREVLKVDHKGLSAKQFIDQYLRDGDHETELHERNGGTLLEFTQYQLEIEISYKVTINWSQNLAPLMGTNEIIVKEERGFQEEPNKITVESNITTHLGYITGLIKREIEDKSDGCTETITIEILYSGQTFPERIESDFYDGFLPHIQSTSKQITRHFSNHNLAAVSRDTDTKYLTMHSSLYDLHNQSKTLLQVIEQTKINRKPLVLPNKEQIQNVVNIIKPENFSMRNEINKMKIEADHTKKIADSLKEARQQTAASSSLPLFVLASCAAVMFVVISNSE